MYLLYHILICKTLQKIILYGIVFLSCFLSVIWHTPADPYRRFPENLKENNMSLSPGETPQDVSLNSCLNDEVFKAVAMQFNNTGELDTQQSRVIRRHISKCDACQSYLKSFINPEVRTTKNTSLLIDELESIHVSVPPEPETYGFQFVDRTSIAPGAEAMVGMEHLKM